MSRLSLGFIDTRETPYVSASAEELMLQRDRWCYSIPEPQNSQTHTAHTATVVHFLGWDGNTPGEARGALPAQHCARSHAGCRFPYQSNSHSHSLRSTLAFPLQQCPCRAGSAAHVASGQGGSYPQSLLETHWTGCCFSEVLNSHLVPVYETFPLVLKIRLNNYRGNGRVSPNLTNPQQI